MNTEIASDNTIYALSTPAGRVAVAIIRISGEKTTQAIDIITKTRFRLRVKPLSDSFIIRRTEV